MIRLKETGMDCLNALEDKAYAGDLIISLGVTSGGKSTMKNSYILLAIIFLISSNISVKASDKFTSQDIYSYANEISKVSKEKIWNGFEALDFAVLKETDKTSQIHFSPEPNNPESFVFMRLSDEYFANHTLEENLTITFHEAFHAFQRSPKRSGKKWGYENAILIFEYQESSARNNALFSIESKILLSALQTKNKKQLKEKVRQFLTVRSFRQNELDKRFVEFEKGAEQNEGMAEYAGTKAVLLGMEKAKSKKINVPFENLDKQIFLDKKFYLLNLINDIGKNVRIKFYYTGSAQGLLLDRLMPNWKTEVQMNGKAIQNLLQDSIPKKALKKNEINEILKNYKYESVLKKEEESVAERNAENLALLEKTLNLKGKKIMIDFSVVNNINNIKFFDPMNVTMVKPNVRVHTRKVTFAHNELFTAEFSQPVVEDLPNKKYISIIPQNDTFKITVDGEEVDLSKGSESKLNGELKIMSENLKLEVKRGSIKFGDKELIIKIEN